MNQMGIYSSHSLSKKNRGDHMWNLLQLVNWEAVGVVLISMLSAYGVTRAWLLKMCSKIESTNLRVEAHKDEIREIMDEMRSIIAEYKELKNK